MTETSVASLLKVRSLNELKRFNIRVTLHPENVSSHSLMTTVLINYVSESLNEEFGLGLDVKSLVLASMSHDFEESELGDVLIPTKKNSDLKSAYSELEVEIKDRLRKDLKISCYLFPIEQDLLRFCDRLEGYIYSLEELELGNKHFDVIRDNYNNEVFESIDRIIVPEVRVWLSEFVKEIENKVSVVRCV